MVQHGEVIAMHCIALYSIDMSIQSGMLVEVGVPIGSGERR